MAEAKKYVFKVAVQHRGKDGVKGEGDKPGKAAAKIEFKPGDLCPDELVDGMKKLGVLKPQGQADKPLDMAAGVRIGKPIDVPITKGAKARKDAAEDDGEDAQPGAYPTRK